MSKAKFKFRTKAEIRKIKRQKLTFKAMIQDII